MDVLLIFLIFIVIAYVQGKLIARFGMRRFSYSRSFSQRTASEGDTVEMTEVIANRSALFLPWVRLEMRVPTQFEFFTREELTIRMQGYHKSVFSLMPFSRVTRRHKVKLGLRGHYQLDHAAMTYGDLLCMHTDFRDISAPAEIYVYPRILKDIPLQLPSSRYQGDVSVHRWIISDPFLVNGIRNYRAGDPLRDIHWAATARTGQFQVKTHDFTADPKLMVLINAQRDENQWGELLDYEQSRIEQGIRMAATLCVRALQNGTEAGFAANMPLDDSKECAFFAPSRGAGREDELLCAMSCLKIKRARSFPTFLDDMSVLRGMDIVILSCYESESIAARMEHLRRMGNSVALYLIPEEEEAADA